MKAVYSKEEKEFLAEAKRKRRVLQEAFKDPESLEILEEHFQVNLPVFQGSVGKFDPLDAMRRDAYREVFLYIRNQVKKYEVE